MKKAIITGPTGGVGTAVISELLKQGYEVTAAVRPGSARIKNIPADAEILECEISALESLAEKLKAEYDLFFHFGWNGTYGESRQNRSEQQKNVRYTCDAVRLAEKLGCCAFVFAGSQSEFGHYDGVLSPDLPCHPDNEYGKAKLDAEKAARELAHERGIRFEALRILSAFGPGDAPYTMVMGTLLAFMHGDERKFTAGDQIWDYIYTKDLARAFVLAAEKGRDGAVYTAGTGRTRTLRAYIEAMRDIAAPERALVFGELPYYPNQVMHLEADISALTADTGFEPAYTFEEGVRETLDWIREYEKDRL